jgi:hypothetical protein
MQHWNGEKKFKVGIQKIHPDLQQVFFKHDNAKPHTSAQSLHIHSLGFTAFDHTSCSPAMTPSDFISPETEGSSKTASLPAK